MHFGLQRSLGLGSYNTTWQWLHKLCRAMVRPDRERLTGVVEVDEPYVGGKRPGIRGRGAEEKEVVIVAVENKGDDGIGRIRIQHIEDASGESLAGFTAAAIQPGATLRTDDWAGYSGLSEMGYERIVKLIFDSLKIGSFIFNGL